MTRIVGSQINFFNSFKATYPNAFIFFPSLDDLLYGRTVQFRHQLLSKYAYRLYFKLEVWV